MHTLQKKSKSLLVINKEAGLEANTEKINHRTTDVSHEEIKYITPGYVNYMIT
jgi:hypothetical protein